MRQRRLGERLRALILATPLIGSPACSSGGYCPNEPDGSSIYSLSSFGDGGRVNGAPCGYSFSVCSDTGLDAGFDCSACAWLLEDQPPPEVNGFPDPQGGCALLTLPDGGPAVNCGWVQACPGGRRPASLLAARTSRAAHPVGAYFARTSRLEVASIPAFRVLARELRAQRAPTHLIDAAVRSAQDEIRHARSTASLARRYGAEPIRPSFGATPSERSLEAIATENAIEGCIRETYGALVALWQARHAQDPVVAAAMAPIAADETRHAELAWEIASWAESQLPRAARGLIEAARSQALDELANEVSHPVAIPLVALAGLPTTEAATAFLRGLATEIGNATIN